MFVCCREQYSGEMEGDSEEEGRETGCHAKVRRGTGRIAPAPGRGWGDGDHAGTHIYGAEGN